MGGQGRARKGCLLLGPEGISSQVGTRDVVGGPVWQKGPGWREGLRRHPEWPGTRLFPSGPSSLPALRCLSLAHIFRELQMCVPIRPLGISTWMFTRHSKLDLFQTKLTVCMLLPSGNPKIKGLSKREATSMHLRSE